MLDIKRPNRNLFTLIYPELERDNGGACNDELREMSENGSDAIVHLKRLIQQRLLALTLTHTQLVAYIDSSPIPSPSTPLGINLRSYS